MVDISRTGDNDIGIGDGSLGAINGADCQSRVALVQPLSQLVLASTPAIDTDGIKARQGMQQATDLRHHIHTRPYTAQTTGIRAGQFGRRQGTHRPGAHRAYNLGIHNGNRHFVGIIK